MKIILILIFMHNSSILGLAYTLGEIREINEFEHFINDPQKLTLFYKAGLKHYSFYKNSILDLAYESGNKTLEKVDIKRDEIQLLIFVFENFNKDHIFHMKDLNLLIKKLGIENAFPIGVTLSDCANILTGLNVSETFILSKKVENILLISVDKIYNQNRIMNPEMSVLSDASVSCIVSSKFPGDFHLTGTFLKNLPDQWYIDRTEISRYSTNKFKYLIHVTKEAFKFNEDKPQDYKYFISSNYLNHITKMFVQICGFKEHQAYYNNISRFGHTIAGDVLINLADLTQSLQPRDKIMLMSDSYSSCSVATLVKS